MEIVGNAVVEFDDDEWPSMTEGIPRAPDLPVEERYGTTGTGRPRCQCAAHSSSDEEDIDDPAPADDLPPGT